MTKDEENEMALIFGLVMVIVFIAAAVIETIDGRRKTKQVEEYLFKTCARKDAA